MSKNKVRPPRVSISIPAEAHARLQAVAGARRLAMWEAISLAINDWTAKQAPLIAKEMEALTVK